MGGGGGGGCGLLSKTLTRFKTQIVDFPYLIYDLTKILIHTLFKTRPLNQYLVSDLSHNWLPISSD